MITGFWPGKALSLKTWENSLAAGISTGSVTRNYLERRQEHEVKSAQNLGPTISF